MKIIDWYKTTKTDNKISLTHEQISVMSQIHSRINAPGFSSTLLHAPGGTGKTHLLRQYVRTQCEVDDLFSRILYKRDGELQTFKVPAKYLVLTPTGIAARNIVDDFLTEQNVMTFHRYFNKILKTQSFNEVSSNEKTLAAEFLSDVNNLKNIKRLDCIIVDEVSMLHIRFVKFILELCKIVKLPILFIGDFYQLPPIPVDMTEVESDDDYETVQKFKFPSTIVSIIECLRDHKTEVFTLTKNMRCPDDTTFNEMLDGYRKMDFSNLCKYPFVIQPELTTIDEGVVNLFFSNRTVRMTNQEIQNDMNFPQNEMVDIYPTIEYISDTIYNKWANETVTLFRLYCRGMECKDSLKHEKKLKEIFEKTCKHVAGVLSNYKLQVNMGRVHPTEKVMVRKNIYANSSMIYANGDIDTFKNVKANIPLIVEKIRVNVDNIILEFNIRFYPVALAYCFATHKVQGLSISNDIRIDLDELRISCHLKPTMYYELLYVAMTRKKGSDKRIILNRPLNEDDIKALYEFNDKSNIIKEYIQ